jgi:hypothetical protein
LKLHALAVRRLPFFVARCVYYGLVDASAVEHSGDELILKRILAPEFGGLRLKTKVFSADLRAEFPRYKELAAVWVAKKELVL